MNLHEYEQKVNYFRKLWKSGNVLIQLTSKCTVWTTGEIIFADCDGNIVAIMQNNFTWKWTGEKCPNYAKNEFMEFLNRIRQQLSQKIEA